jgi:tetratricopeptide (TPR) repeat protein
MASQSNTASDLILARQVPQSIRFLRKLKVPATRIAGIFGETADSIRHIDDRAYAKAPADPALVSFDKNDLALLRLSDEKRRAQYRRNIQGIRLRSKQDLDHAEANIWAIFQSHQSVGFEEGYEALLAMLPSVANARHGQALKVRLLLEEKLAWFALPLGRIEMALAHAQRAMRAARKAFRESAGEGGYLLRYGEAALVASICLQKLHKPERAIDFIRAADEANEALGQRPGSEHLRQYGACFLQMGENYDDLAERQFKRAPKRMLRKGEVNHEVDLGMSGLRQLAFLDPAWGWDKALELADAVKSAYGANSMQYSVAAKSAAVAGLKYATPEATSTALKLLDEISPTPPENAAKGVRHILSITSDLKLSPDDLDRWLRFAMNEAPLPFK